MTGTGKWGCLRKLGQQGVVDEKNGRGHGRGFQGLRMPSRGLRVLSRGTVESCVLPPESEREGMGQGTGQRFLDNFFQEERLVREVAERQEDQTRV